MYRIFYFLTLTFLLYSCSTESSNVSNYKVDSSGPVNIVSVFADQDNYNNLEEVLNDSVLFGKIYPGLYWPPEVMFGTRQFDKDLYGRFKNTRLVLNVEEGEPGIEFEKNKYSKPQAYIRVSGNNQQEIANLLRANSDSILNFYKQTDLQFILNGFDDKSHSETNELNALGLSMKVPKEYVLVESNEDFVWYRKDRFNTIQNRSEKDNGIITQQSQDIINLLFYTTPYSKSKLTKTDIIQIRDSIGKLYTKGNKEPQTKRIGKDSIPTLVSDHAQTEQTPMLRDFYEFKKVSEQNNIVEYDFYAYWSMSLTQMGGPVAMRILYNKNENKLYIADAFMFAPLNQGKSKKRDYLTEINALFTTLELNK